MNTDNPIKYSDLIQPDDSISKLIKQLDDLSDSYMNVYENIRKNALAVKASLEGVSGATESGRKTIRAAADDSDKLTKALKERQFAESELAKKIAEVKAATSSASITHLLNLLFLQCCAVTILRIRLMLRWHMKRRRTAKKITPACW